MRKLDIKNEVIACIALSNFYKIHVPVPFPTHPIIIRKSLAPYRLFPVGVITNSPLGVKLAFFIRKKKLIVNSSKIL
jgi:hypothetical protein